MGDDAQPLDELMAPYVRPYRHYIPAALDAAGARTTLVGGGAFALLSLGATFATQSTAFLVSGAIGVVFAFALIAKWAVQAAIVVRRLTRGWDERSELGTIRARRPHAADEASDVAHDQYTVSVEDDGALLIWRYIPLAVTDRVPHGHLLVPGRPSFAAVAVESRPPESDTVRAAAQLVEAQARAAELEAEAIEHARGALDAAIRRRELEKETASTVAALRDHTGQGDRR
jgi:hypothetical protein